MKKLLAKILGCKSCQKRRSRLDDWSRRSFIGKVVAGAIGLALLPVKLLAQLECQCIFCPWQYCLCCECPTGCTIIDEGDSLIVCDKCGGPLKCYGVGCGSQCPPGFTCTMLRAQAESKKKITFSYYWMLTLTDDGKLWVGADEPFFDAMTWFNAHPFHKDSKDGPRVYAKASHRIPESPKA